MALTLKQFAFFNTPIAPDAYVPPEDAWLFSDPVKAYAPGHPEKEIFKTYKTAASRGPRRIGLAKIESRLILKVRHVHYSDFVKVPAIDAVKEPI